MTLLLLAFPISHIFTFCQHNSVILKSFFISQQNNTLNCKWANLHLASCETKTEFLLFQCHNLFQYIRIFYAKDSRECQHQHMYKFKIWAIKQANKKITANKELEYFLTNNNSQLYSIFYVLYASTCYFISFFFWRNPLGNLQLNKVKTFEMKCIRLFKFHNFTIWYIYSLHVFRLGVKMKKKKIERNVIFRQAFVKWKKNLLSISIHNDSRRSCETFSFIYMWKSYLFIAWIKWVKKRKKNLNIMVKWILEISVRDLNQFNQFSEIKLKTKFSSANFCVLKSRY